MKSELNKESWNDKIILKNALTDSRGSRQDPYSTDMQRRRGHGHTAWHVHPTWSRTCSIDIYMQQEDGHGASEFT